MELFLKNGDYTPDGKGGFQRAQGTEELLQRVLFKLTVRRGSFPFLPELGSELYKLTREKPSAWQGLARQYVVQALEGEEVAVTDVAVMPRDGGVQVEVFLDWQGESLNVSVEL